MSCLPKLWRLEAQGRNTAGTRVRRWLGKMSAIVHLLPRVIGSNSFVISWPSFPDYTCDPGCVMLPGDAQALTQVKRGECLRMQGSEPQHNSWRACAQKRVSDYGNQ